MLQTEIPSSASAEFLQNIPPHMFNLGKMNWFVVQCYANTEVFAEINIRKLGYQTYLPQYKIPTVMRGKDILKYRPLFPGYIFVEFNRDLPGWRRICTTRGVNCVLGAEARNNYRPSPLPLEFVGRLQESEAAWGAAPLLASPTPNRVHAFRRDSPVLVESGPLAGQAGKFLKPLKNNFAEIILTLLSVPVRVRLPITALAPMRSTPEFSDSRCRGDHAIN